VRRAQLPGGPGRRHRHTPARATWRHWCKGSDSRLTAAPGFLKSDRSAGLATGSADARSCPA
jgi:hypothetical protein